MYMWKCPVNTLSAWLCLGPCVMWLTLVCHPYSVCLVLKEANTTDPSTSVQGYAGLQVHLCSPISVSHRLTSV